MPFHFPLAPVLKLRESLEERELHLLEQTQFQIARAVRLLEELRSQRHAALAVRERQLACGSVGADLHCSEHTQRQLQEQGQALEASLAELHLRRTQQMKIYEQAKQNRQALSELLEEQQAAYQDKLAHQEQRRADDRFLARFRRG